MRRRLGGLVFVLASLPFIPALFNGFTDWDDPVFKVFDPPLILTAGQGVRFEATHAYLDPPSSSAPPLTFGLTSEDEMAIILGYYAVK